jgi:hypothetical protein
VEGRVHPRTLTVYPDEQSGFVALRAGGGEPIRGVDMYRAALRLDLVEKHARQVERRRFLWIGAGLAVVSGPVLGWAFGKALQETEQEVCIYDPPPPGCGERTPEEKAADEKAMRQAVGVGTAVGALLGGGLGWAATRVRPHTPTLEEARALADEHNARLVAPPAPPPPATLRLVPLVGGAHLAVRLRF